MNLRKRVFLLFLPLFIVNICSAQNDSCDLTISLLTCSPGEDLYSIFGHSAIRVNDPASGQDVVYNYGTFEFDEEFYVKFVQGKLLYYVAPERFNSFMIAYRMENRSVIEQVLHLSCEAKGKLNYALQNNIRPENRHYLYEFLFDNCSTRLRDMVAKNANDSVTFHPMLPAPAPTFRNMIHEYLNRGQQFWSKLGIDLLLGSRMDRQATNFDAMFLPDYLMMGFDNASVAGAPLVASKRTILPAHLESAPGKAFFTPFAVTVVLLLAGGISTLSKNKRIKRFLDVFDTVLFAIIGLLGCLILYMWFGTEHELCANNYNLLWALPTHLPVAFFMLRQKKWLSTYFAVSALIYLLVLIAWAFLPQGMNAAFLPLVALAGLRSVVRAQKNNSYGGTKA